MYFCPHHRGTVVYSSFLYRRILYVFTHPLQTHTKVFTLPLQTHTICIHPSFTDAICMYSPIFYRRILYVFTHPLQTHTICIRPSFTDAYYMYSPILYRRTLKYSPFLYRRIHPRCLAASRRRTSASRPPTSCPPATDDICTMGASLTVWPRATTPTTASNPQ